MLCRSTKGARRKVARRRQPEQTHAAFCHALARSRADDDDDGRRRRKKKTANNRRHREKKDSPVERVVVLVLSLRVVKRIAVGPVCAQVGRGEGTRQEERRSSERKRGTAGAFFFIQSEREKINKRKKLLSVVDQTKHPGSLSGKPARPAIATRPGTHHLLSSFLTMRESPRRRRLSCALERIDRGAAATTLPASLGVGAAWRAAVPLVVAPAARERARFMVSRERNWFRCVLKGEERKRKEKRRKGLVVGDAFSEREGCFNDEELDGM